jgi:hypothetical protein
MGLRRSLFLSMLYSSINQKVLGVGPQHGKKKPIISYSLDRLLRPSMYAAA